MRQNTTERYSIGNTVKYKGGVIKLIQDDDPQSPREWDNLGTILYTSSRYILGDKRVSADEIQEIAENPDNIVLPVYAYIHSGVRLSTGPFSCPWDSGQCGIIYCTQERAKKEGMTTEQIRACLEGEIETFNEYLSGNVAGKEVYFQGELIDSCYGYYPDEDGYFTQPIDEAKSSINYARKKQADSVRTKRQQTREYLAFL